MLACCHRLELSGDSRDGLPWEISFQDEDNRGGLGRATSPPVWAIAARSGVPRSDQQGPPELGRVHWQPGFVTKIPGSTGQRTKKRETEGEAVEASRLHCR